MRHPFTYVGVALVMLSSIILQDLSSASTLRWLGTVLVMKNKPLRSSHCKALQRARIFKKAQRSFCLNATELMLGIQRGSALGMSECQAQFKDHLWNCSLPAQLKLEDLLHKRKRKRDLANPNTNSLKTSRKNSVREAMLAREGSKESAFLHAISAASITYEITRSCTLGRISSCGCDRSAVENPDQYKYAGCSENVRYGSAIAYRFMSPTFRTRKRNSGESPEQRLRQLRRRAAYHANSHNREAGVAVVERRMAKKCKCHGLSGSCQAQTCWKLMEQLDVVSTELKRMYDLGSRVDLITERDGRHRLLHRNRALQPPTRQNLVYTEESPNFCQRNLRHGSLGTEGRVCNRTDNGAEGTCGSLCCGRGHSVRRVTVERMCDCQFVYCCRVECKTCYDELDQATCN